MANRFQISSDDISVFVPPDAIYPGLPADESALIELLSELSRDDTLLICARLNTIVSGFGMLNGGQRQQKACAWICNHEQKQLLDTFVRQHGGLDRVVVFFRGQLLEMMRRVAQHCQNLPGDGETFNDGQVRNRFFRSVLIAGALWSDRIFGNNRLSLQDGLDAARVRALGAFGKGVEDSSQALHTAIALGRGWLLFSDYLPRKMPDFANRFEGATGLTVEQYLICVGALTTFTFAERVEGPLFRTADVGAATGFKDVFPTYLALESLTPEELAKAAPDLPRTGFRALRQRPVLSTSGGLSVVLDPAIYGETLAIGPLFHLVAEKNTLGYFGSAFEDYAIDVLRQMYPTGSGLAQRLTTNISDRDGTGADFEIDAALNDVSEIVIFEMKAAWLREDSLLDATGADFVHQLRRKYGVLPAEGGARERPKGAAQLAKTIGAIARKEWMGANGEFAKAAKIYPVLVVYDERLGVPGSGKFLDDEFKSLLGTVSPGVLIAPLTIMTIGDLENLETSVTSFGLRDLLRDYTRECPDGMRSLHQFMATSSYAPKLKASKRVLEASEELMSRMRNGLFPKAVGAAEAKPSGSSDR